MAVTRKMLKEKFKKYWKKEKFRVWFVTAVIALALVVRGVSELFTTLKAMFPLYG